MKKNKKSCGPIFSEEQKISFLNGFQKQSNHTTVSKYAKANNVKESTLFNWSRRYEIPLGFHHRNQLPKEQKITLLEGFQKQNTYTTIESYAKANNANKHTLKRWSVRYKIPLGYHHRSYRKAFSEEQKIALLEGLQKQKIYTTIESYEKANNANKGSLNRWSRRYGIPLEWHPRKTLPKEQRIALLEGFQKQNTYTTLADYAKANNANKHTLRKWSVLYGMPLGWHHRKALPKEQKIALLEGFQKQNTYTTIESYAKANNVTGYALYGWSVLYGMPLGRHYTKEVKKTQNTKRIKKKPTQKDPLL